MAEALNDAVHVARVRQVLQPGDTVAINADVAAESTIYCTDLPLLHCLHLGSTLRLVETQILSLAHPRAVLGSLTVAEDGIREPTGVLDQASLLYLFSENKPLPAECAGLIRVNSKFGFKHFLFLFYFNLY